MKVLRSTLNTLMNYAAILLLSIGICRTVSAQCAPGTPSAGNPACIPPNQQNSPYYQGDRDVDAYPAQPQIRWENRWGAIAVDLKLAQGGSAVDQANEAAASHVALARCASNGGTDCQVIQVFKNQCAAVVQPSGGGSLSTATAATSEEAESRAMARCGGEGACQTIFNECSLPERIQ